MNRSIFITLILLICSFGIIYFFVGVPSVYQESTKTIFNPHTYENETESIKKISIVAFYFVPKNKKDDQNAEWQGTLASSLEQLKEFHSFQFQGNSNISYIIYPLPVVGLEESIFYDTTSTQFGNPHALESITRELDARFNSSNGDLYNAQIHSDISESFTVMIILYEGVGASGTDKVALLSRVFLTDDEYRDYGTTLLAHEFYHTIGVPEGYEVPSAKALTQDVMGNGRYTILNQTYLEYTTLNKLGI